jgi:hypothetical protein
MSEKHVGKSKIYFYFWSQHYQFTIVYLSHKCQMCNTFQYFVHHIEIFWEKSTVYQQYHLFGNDTDPDRPAPDLDHAK